MKQDKKRSKISLAGKRNSARNEASERINLKIGTLVRQHREKAGMTQLDLSRKLGYQTTQFVSLFERGLSKIPHQTLGKLVVLLGIPEKSITKCLVEGYASALVNDIKKGKQSLAG